MALNPVRSKSEARERGRAGGIASGQARRLKKSVRSILEAMLSGKIEVEGVRVSRLEAILAAQVKKALDGDTRAFSAILDRLEGRPGTMPVVNDDASCRVVDFGDPLDVRVEFVSAKDGRKLEEHSPEELTEMGRIAFRGTPEEQEKLMQELIPVRR